jgi:hypothetical protein
VLPTTANLCDRRAGVVSLAPIPGFGARLEFARLDVWPADYEVALDASHGEGGHVGLALLALFFVGSQVPPLLRNLEKLLLEVGVGCLLGELFTIARVGAVLIDPACRHKNASRLHWCNVIDAGSVSKRQSGIGTTALLRHCLVASASGFIISPVAGRGRPWGANAGAFPLSATDPDVGPLPMR